MRLSNGSFAIQLGDAEGETGIKSFRSNRKKIHHLFSYQSIGGEINYWIVITSSKWPTFAEQVNCRYALLIKYHFVEFVQLFWTATSPLPPTVTGINGNFRLEATVCFVTRKESGDNFHAVQSSSPLVYYVHFPHSLEDAADVLTHRKCFLSLT